MFLKSVFKFSTLYSRSSRLKTRQNYDRKWEMSSKNVKRLKFLKWKFHWNKGTFVIRRIRCILYNTFSSVQSLSLVRLFATPWLQHARPPCPSPTPGVHPNSCPLSQWCHPAISSSIFPFSSCPQSLLASESFPMSQLFAWGGQSIGVSALASVLPKNTQNWSPLEWTGWISLQWFAWFILKYLDFYMCISIFLLLLWASKMLRAGLPTHLKKERNMLKKKQLSLNVQTCHSKTLSHSAVWIAILPLESS